MTKTTKNKEALPEGPLTLEFFRRLPKGVELKLYYWCHNRGDMLWKHDRVATEADQLNEERVYGQFWDDRPSRGNGSWCEVGDYLYEFAGVVCRGSGAEPVHAVEPKERDAHV